MRFILLIIALALAGPAFAQNRQLPSSRTEMQLSFASVVRQVTPAVTNIYTKRQITLQSPISPLMNDPFFRQFVGPELGLMNRPQQRTVSSLGSGVIVSPDGRMVTSAHVIQDAGEIRVQLLDGREFDAELLRTDPLSDLALLQIRSSEPLPYLTLGNSDALEIGDLVLAIGNPFGVGQTVTSGIISALTRAAAGASPTQRFIQTDAAINPGNSGGALVDMNGHLAGINTAIYSKTGGYQGIGFAIPAEAVQRILSNPDGALPYGAVTLKGNHPLQGMTVAPAQGELADDLDLDVDGGGLLVLNTGGSRFGIRQGDRILAVQEQPVQDVATLERLLNASNSRWKLSVLRGDKVLTLLVQI